MNGGWLKKTKGWMSIHEYEWRMNKEELKDGWVYMNMNGRWTLRMDEYAWIRMDDE